jgi:hypothetical protein
MFAPSGDYSESRPFKIFISLLDKWEIGAALTDVLVYDAFKAIKQFVGLHPDTAEDVRHCLFAQPVGLILYCGNRTDDHDCEYIVRSSGTTCYLETTTCRFCDRNYRRRQRFRGLYIQKRYM